MAVKEETAPLTTEQLIEQVKENVESLRTKRQEHLDAIEAIDAEINAVREMLPVAVEDDDDVPVTAKERTRVSGNGRSGRPRGRPGSGPGGALLRDLCRDLIKKAGPKGITKRELAQSILDDGFETPTVTVKQSSPKYDEQFKAFCGSVFVSGINKLTQAKEVEIVRGVGEGREGRYRLAK
jgi:hypothetical protein